MERPSISEPTVSVKRDLSKDPSDHTRETKSVKMSESVQYNFEQNPLEHAQATLLTSGTFSDLEITCKGRTWNVHRCILATRCPFFGERINVGIIFDYTHFAGVISCRRSDKLMGLMNGFCEHLGAPALKLRWLHKGAPFHSSETPATLSMQDGGCLDVVKEQSPDDQLVEWVREAKKGMKPVRREDGMHSNSPQDVSVINMDDDDPDAVESMLYYLYTQQTDYSRRLVDHSIGKDVQHFLLAIGLGDKYDLPLFAGTARTKLEACIKASDGMVLPQVIRALHLETASKSLVAMRDFVVGETTAFFCSRGQFKNVMESLAIEFPKFGFDVLNHATKELMRKIEKIEEGKVEEAGDDEDEEDEPIRQLKPKRYGTRAKAVTRGAAKSRDKRC